MAEFRTDGGGVLNEDLVRKVFEYDDHAEEARAADCAAAQRQASEARLELGGAAELLRLSEEVVAVLVGVVLLSSVIFVSFAVFEKRSPTPGLNEMQSQQAFFV